MIDLKGAIFDVDGTILDSMTAWYDITVDYFRGQGIILGSSEADRIQNMTLEESIPYIRNKYLPQMSAETIFAGFKARMEHAYRSTIPPKSGVCEYIRRLHLRGVRIAVATSGFPELCTSAFRRIGIYGYIDAYAYSSEVGCGKDRPDVYLLAAKRLGAMPCDCEVYEDIITGVMSAKKAGFTVTAVADPTNAHDKERLIRHSDHYITGWDELLSKI